MCFYIANIVLKHGLRCQGLPLFRATGYASDISVRINVFPIRLHSLQKINDASIDDEFNTKFTYMTWIYEELFLCMFLQVVSLTLLMYL